MAVCASRQREACRARILDRLAPAGRATGPAVVTVDDRGGLAAERHRHGQPRRRVRGRDEGELSGPAKLAGEISTRAFERTQTPIAPAASSETLTSRTSAGASLKPATRQPRTSRPRTTNTADRVVSLAAASARRVDQRGQRRRLIEPPEGVEQPLHRGERPLLRRRSQGRRLFVEAARRASRSAWSAAWACAASSRARATSPAASRATCSRVWVIAAWTAAADSSLAAATAWVFCASASACAWATAARAASARASASATA